MSCKASETQERQKAINDYFEDDEDIEDFMTSYSTQSSTKQTTDFDDDDDDNSIEDYMQSYSTPVKVNYSDDDTGNLWEDEDSFEEVLNKMMSVSPKISNNASELNLLDDKELNDMGTVFCFSDEELVLDYMNCYNTQTFTNENNVDVLLDIKSLTDNSFDVDLYPQSNSENIGKKTEKGFKKAVLPNGDKPEPSYKKPCFISGQKPEASFKKPCFTSRQKPVASFKKSGFQSEQKTAEASFISGQKPEASFKKPCFISGQKPEASFKKPYVSKWSENFRKQHIEGKHRPNKPVNTVADFESGGGFKILRKSGSCKNSVVPGRHEGQIKVVTKAAIPYRETGFKRRGQTGSKLFMVTAKKLHGVDTVVPEHLDGVATWENGKIRVGQEIYSQCTQQTQRYMC